MKFSFGFLQTIIIFIYSKVSDVYDEIDIDCTKETLQMALSDKQFFSFNSDEIQIPKRARLDVNYSIAPASINIGGTHQHQSRRKMPLINRIA